MGAEVRKVPSPLPSSTDTVLDPLLVTTRSGRPSRLKSPTAMDVGVAVATAGAARKVPSPLKSPRATLIETLPTGKSRRAVIETASARAGAGETSTTRSAAAASRTHRADFVLMTFVLASGVLPTHRWPRLASKRGFAGPGETHRG